jgi:hypothetical protein
MTIGQDIIETLRTRIARDTAALHNAKPSGYGSYTAAELTRSRDFLRGMIHAYRVVTNFNAVDSYCMAGAVDDAWKNAQRTFKDAKELADAAEAERAVVQADTL